MGYDLRPRHKEIGDFHFGAFNWGWMLDAGVGLVLGAGPSIKPATFRYSHDKKGRCPYYNEGFHVTSKDAKTMALIAYGLVSVEKGKWSEWNSFTDDEKRTIEEPRMSGVYRRPVREDFIEKVERFATWAVQSGGFWIY